MLQTPLLMHEMKSRNQQDWRIIHLNGYQTQAIRGLE